MTGRHRDGPAQLFRSALCVALVVAAPIIANARWSTHGGGHRYGVHYARSERGPRDRDYTPRYRAYTPRDSVGAFAFTPLITSPCGLELRDSRGRLKRCPAARAAFERDNPCPSTGLPRGACPGYVVDHIVPLKRGGADDPSNMQWQTTDDARAKDKVE